VFPLLNPSSISARRRDLKFEWNGLTTAKLYNKLTKEYIRDMIQDTPWQSMNPWHGFQSGLWLGDTLLNPKITEDLRLLLPPAHQRDSWHSTPSLGPGRLPGWSCDDPENGAWLVAKWSTLTKICNVYIYKVDICRYVIVRKIQYDSTCH
jgi:hypothetical protein